MYSYAIGEVRYRRPPMSFPERVSAACELTCTGQGGEPLPSPLPRHALSTMHSDCKPSASVRGLLLDGSNLSFTLGFKVYGHRSGSVP